VHRSLPLDFAATKNIHSLTDDLMADEFIALQVIEQESKRYEREQTDPSDHDE
jgi:hypothetical protein